MVRRHLHDFSGEVMAIQKLRALTHLEKTASTSRVLNLRSVFKKNGQNPEYTAHPMFLNTTLNRAILVKHRVREHERDDFAPPKTTATKLIIPIDPSDLNAGGQYVFVGQKHFAKIVSDHLNVPVRDLANDLNVLNLLDKCNSFDPFLLREYLSKRGVNPAQCYFDVTDADNTRMLAFTKREIAPLVNKSIGKVSNGIFTDALSRKLLSDYTDENLQPLRETLQMTIWEFREGVFCWKAFLYYKWQILGITKLLPELLNQMSKAIPRGIMDTLSHEELKRLRHLIRRRVIDLLANIRDMIGVYERAYAGLIQGDDPMPFKQFLLDAPQIFHPLGERLAGIDHVVSYWKHRRGSSDESDLTVQELLEIFRDFDQSLTFETLID